MALEKSKRRDTCGPTVDVIPVPIGAGPCLDQHPMPSPAGSPWQGCTAAQGGQNADRVPSASPDLRGAGGLVRLHVCISPPLPTIRQLQAAGMNPGIYWDWGERGLFGQLWPGKIHWGSPKLAPAFPSSARPRT